MSCDISIVLISDSDNQGYSLDYVKSSRGNYDRLDLHGLFFRSDILIGPTRLVLGLFGLGNDNFPKNLDLEDKVV
jgi:hypothetical protein